MLLLACVACAGCGRGLPPLPESDAPPPVTLNFAHLLHLTRALTVNGQPVRVVVLYANAPEYVPTGSPQRDGLEGIASVDDAARAAVLYLRDFETTGDTLVRHEALGLLAFVAAMEQGDGEFLNFVDTAGHENRTAASSRKRMSYWAARGIWAFGEAERVLGPAVPTSLHAARDRAVARMAREIDAGRLVGGSATATSEALLGLLALQRAAPDPARAALALRIARLLVGLAHGDATHAPWRAHLDTPTSAWHAWGARTVMALAQAGMVLGHPELVAAAREEADGLWSRFLLAAQVPALVTPDGTAEWYPQIAYGVGSIAEGLVALADATGDRRYAVEGGLVAAWLLGANPTGIAMYDARTGRTFDGVDGPSPLRLNKNSGAESTVESLLAIQAVSRNADAVEYLRYRPAGTTSASLANVPAARTYSGPGGRLELRMRGGRLELTESHGPVGPITLTYWPAANPSEVRLATVLTEHWNREHPDVQVRVQPLPAGRSTEEVLLAAIVARATPDVCSNVSSALLSRLVRANGVVRMDNLAPTAARLAERTTTAMLAPLRLPDDGIYSFPWKTNPEMLLYNVDLLSAAGIAPPRNHTELLNAFRRLAKDTDGDDRLDHWALWAPLKTTWFERFYDFYPLYLASSGGRTLVTNGKVLFDNAAAVSAIEVLRAGFAQGLLPKANFALGRDPFMDGTVAMKIIGPWFLKELDAAKPAGLHYAVAPIPPADGVSPADAYAFADLRSIAIFATTTHPDAAARFVAYLTSPEADRLLIEEASQLPYRRALAGDPRFAAPLAASPVLAGYARLVEHTRDIDIDPDIVEIFDLLSEAYEAAGIYGVTPVRTALARAATEARKIIDAR